MVERAFNFPFPRKAGKLFIYNEFCVSARGSALVASAGVDGEGCPGGRADVVLGDAVGELAQDKSVVGDVHDAQVGDDALDDAFAGQGQ